MAYDEDLAARVRELLAEEPVDERRMFGGLAFLLRGHLATAVSSEGGLLVRVDPAQTAELLAEPGTSPFSMGGRAAVKGWLRVDAADLDDAQVRAWVQRGVAYARSLPPKGA